MKNIVCGIVLLLPMCCFGGERTVRDLLAEEGARPAVVANRLDVAGRVLTSLAGLDEVPNIDDAQELDASNNHLAQLGLHALNRARLPFERVDLSHNRIAQVNDDIFGGPAVVRHAPPVDIDVAHNWLPAEELERLHGQMERVNRPGLLHSVTKVGEKVVRLVHKIGAVGLIPAYLISKLIMHNEPRCARANAILRASVNGAWLIHDLYEGAKRLIRDRQLPSLREVMVAMQTAVNAHDVLNPKNTVADIVTRSAGFDFRLLKYNPLYWLAALPAMFVLHHSPLRGLTSAPLLPVVVSPMARMNSLWRFFIVKNIVGYKLNWMASYVANKFTHKKYSLARMHGSQQQI